jgi:hypothetical protein
MFGGLRQEDQLSSPEAWRFQNGQWAQVPTLAPPDWPAARYEAVMFEVGGYVVLFGGLDDDGNAFGDTWTWNGSQWMEQTPPHSPPARFAAAGVGWNGYGLVFGGLDGTGTPQNDTWLWDGSDWRDVTPMDTTRSPSLRSQAAAATLGDSVFLFGGQGLDGPLGDTWKWDGVQWSLLDAPGPAARYGSAMTPF